MDESKLTHLSERGEAHMVDVGEKAVTRRIAVARTQVQMQPQTLELIESAGIKKGDVFSVARIAGIMAAKQTSALIPLCHPLQLTRVEVTMAGRRTEAEARVEIEAVVETRDRTGVEMEALTAASIAALTIYDMCKAVDRGMIIHQTYLARKEGGKSGLFLHERERE